MGMPFLFFLRSNFGHLIDKSINRTCLRTTIQVSTKTVTVTLSKSSSLFGLFR